MFFFLVMRVVLFYLPFTYRNTFSKLDWPERGGLGGQRAQLLRSTPDFLILISSGRVIRFRRSFATAVALIRYRGGGTIYNLLQYIVRNALRIFANPLK